MDKIEEAAKNYSGFKQNQNPNDDEERYFASEKCRIFDAFIAGVKSSEAKEYWQRGMYTEKQIYEMLNKCDSEGGLRWDEVEEWFKQHK